MTETKLLCLDGSERDGPLLDEAADILRRGGIVAFPTETVYGLGANGLDGEAVRRIFLAKGRPQDNPLILHVPDDSWLYRYCRNVPAAAFRLTKKFWPGPLTLVLEKRENVSDVTTAGLPTVGMRCPRHPAARELIRRAGVPVAAPSANLSGRPSTTTFGHVLRDLDGRADAILDGGDCEIGVESTILDMTVTPPRLLRPGAVTLEELRRELGTVEVDPAVLQQMQPGEHPRAPGMKYRHYAPAAPVKAVCGRGQLSAAYIARKLEPGDGVLCWDEYRTAFPGRVTVPYGSETDKKAQAVLLFDALRKFDETGVTRIWAQCPDNGGVGLAVANRLKKAAGFDVTELAAPVIGLTGPTGAGKTSALAVLAEMGARIADCDAVYHELLQTSEGMRRELADRFPGAVTAGELDRKALGRVVFNDPLALAELNRITHAWVYRRVVELAAEAEEQGAPLFAIDAIALIESGLGELCDLTVAVTASRETRVRRIMARENISEEYARSRVSAQKPDSWFREHCDVVLENDGEIGEFQDSCRRMFGRYLQLHRMPSLEITSKEMPYV